MHPQWQDIATRLERDRKAMTKLAALHRDKAIVSAAEAPSLDVTVLGKDATTGIVHLGVFKMPSIPKDIMKPPKGVCSKSIVEYLSVCGTLLLTQLHLTRLPSVCSRFSRSCNKL